MYSDTNILKNKHILECFLARDDQKIRNIWLNSEICKSELRGSNRRPAKCVENILCKTKTSQMKILLGQSQIALRKCNSRIQNAGNLKQQRTFDSLIFHNEGFKFLRASRSSPPYFGKAKRDLFVMKTVRSSFLVL